jgi:hypothetical protein
VTLEIVAPLARYSYLKASVGLILVARRAGTTLATSATAPKIATAKTNVTGSAPLTPASSVPVSLAADSANPAPIPTPRATNSKDPASTSRSTPAGRAPSAILIPISRVRRATVKCNTP